ncbi:hypothetical protein D9757_000802 [Collybiopsis confluens]|uniref:RRM domain-containing protein n=1 Tax=Collybiopsis confluens TaxID=2823264 RepID=A0A8H5I0M2_9AGAR|nr:hypothetical protein D9757_000802 [Collybiopsis confluens]
MSKVVFVGNVPYNMGEEQLIDVFKSVGQVVGFRLVFDRDTGKPKGYGFCEFAGTFKFCYLRSQISSDVNTRLCKSAPIIRCCSHEYMKKNILHILMRRFELWATCVHELLLHISTTFYRHIASPIPDHETAASAVRNLNNFEVGGRPLRIDLADSDPFLEGKTTVRGELLDGGGPSDRWRSETNQKQDFLSSLPPGIPVPPGSTVLDTISTALATMNPSQLMDVLAHMKAFVITHPEQTRALLVAHPQLAYALFQALLLNKIVDQSILQRMLAATVGPTISAPAPAPPAASAPPPQFYPPNGSHYGASSHMPPFPPNIPPPMFAPPPGSMHTPNFYRPTPPPGLAPPSQVQPPPLHPGPSSTPVLQQPSPIQASMYSQRPPPLQ